MPGGRPKSDKLIVGGPYDPSGRGDTASRAEDFRVPARADRERGTGVRADHSHDPRAPRVPAAGDARKTSSRCIAFYQRARRAAATSRAASRRAIEAMLVSPEFLFRIEQDPRRPQAGNGVPASATSSSRRGCRSSCGAAFPTTSCSAWPSSGGLSDPAVLERQVRRMLDDPRADALVSNFAGQWLHLRNVETVKPDPVILPFDESLRQAFLTETTLFVSSIFREDRSLLDLLSADYTFVNQRLAEHYGIPRVYGSQFRRVTVTDENRRGLLGQGSVLTVTSYPNRTSVVQRGKWILENLLGTPPPPPPADVPELKAAPHGKVLSMREQMQAHRANPVCAACHARMDPIGFALENYDARRAVARPRTRARRSTRAAGCPTAPSSRVRPG